MKKRTKTKLKKYSKKLIKALAKIIFVYPFKGIWFVTKHSYSAIKESVQEGNRKRKEKSKIKEMNKLREKARTESQVEVKKENIKKTKTTTEKLVPQYDPLTELKNKNGDLSSFETQLYNNKSMIGIILGARGTGKSAIGMRFLENFMIKTDKKTYALGFKQNSLPNWIKVVKNIEEIENDSVILIDEGGIEFSSRKSMSNANKLLSELLLIARHKDLSVMFIAQNSSNLEINAIRQTDYLILKPSSLLQKDFERKKIKQIYERVEKDFAELAEDPGLTYVYGSNYHGFISNSLPSFWSEKVSKGYAGK